MTVKKRKTTKRSTKPKRKITRKKSSKNRSHVSKHGGQQLLVFHPHSRLPFPEVTFTTLNQALSGVIDMTSSTGLNAQDSFNYVCLNGLLKPFVDFTTANKITIQSGSSAVATSNPVGFTTICNQNLYNAYTVISAKIRLRLFPQAIDTTVDDYMVSITPVLLSSGGTAPSTPANLASALAQPRTKSLSFAAYAQKRVLTSSNRVSELAGIDSKDVMNDLTSTPATASGVYTGLNNTNFGITNPNALYFWVINIQTVNGAVPTKVLPFEIVVSYRVKFWQLDGDTIVGG